jgi:hypothetical protein
MAFIIVRDIPKQIVQLDLTAFRVGGGFRGFANALEGYHHLKVRDGERWVFGEVWLERAGAAAVLRYDDGRLVADAPEEAGRFAHLAASGAMSAALVDALAQPDAPARALAWREATSAIDRPLDEVGAGPSLEGPSRFVAFIEGHGGDARAALREVQAAFVRAAARDDATAAARLFAVLAACFGAGERNVSAYSSFFDSFAPTVAAMLTLTPALRGAPQLATKEQLVEDLADAGLTAAAERLRGA